MDDALPGKRHSWRRPLPAALAAAWLAVILTIPATAQTSQDRDTRAASLIMQADDLYAGGQYSKAVDIYRQAALLAASRPNLSRAYLGLSLCYFYLNDIPDAKANILKVLEIDPKKEVSSLFHPQSYVDLFEQVKKENADRLGRGLPPVATEEPRAPEAPAKPAPSPKVTALAGGQRIGPRGGRWEIGVHYSWWGLNLAKGLFEDALLKSAAKEIRKNVNSQLTSLAAGRLTPSTDSHGLLFDSEGTNYGAEIRYYPRGRRGSLSVGLSIEQTHVQLTMKGPVTQNYTDGSSATVEGDAVIVTDPLTTHLSFRWDFVPSSRITPYFIFGLGLGPLNGDARYNYTGTYVRGSQQATITGSWVKTFDQLREDQEIELDLLLMAHAALGLKAEIIRGVILEGEAGFWDGLIARVGLAFRL